MTRTLNVAFIPRAARVIDPVFLDTPFLRRTSLDAALGMSLSMKVETLNPIRSFKGRGAEFFVAERPGATPLVCASAGNFGQGLAWAGRRRGRPVVVFAATGANPMKIAAMRGFGAEVILAGADFDAAKAAARQYAEESGGVFVEDGAEPEIAEGAGTLALEMLEQGLDADAVLIPLGNGALAGGVAQALKSERPGIEILCVVAAGAPAMKLSLETGRSVRTRSAATIADGVAVREPVPYALQTLAPLVDATVAVGEDATIEAMRLLARHAGLVVEPAGAIGLAAILENRSRFGGRRVATILCGGNVDPARLGAWLV
ncbi:MAG: pyridoxal-phosphate dependent enzyme [Parvularculaceae bacterium]|nr:pyridoxal-phosphate dependent enzyme [Parvularculaceae bacterium]